MKLPNFMLGSRGLAWAGGLLAVALLGGGMLAEGWEAMAPNVFATAAGIVLTVSLVAIALEHLELRRRRERWNRVHVHTLSRIQEQLLQCAQLLVVDQQVSGGSPPVFDHTSRSELTTRNLAEELGVMLVKARPLTIAESQLMDLAFAPTLNGIAYHLRPVVDAYTPVVMAFDDDTALIDALTDLAYRTEFIRRWPEDLPASQQALAAAGLAGRPLVLGPEQAKVYLIDFLECAETLAVRIDARLPADDHAVPWSERVRAAFPELGS